MGREKFEVLLNGSTRKSSHVAFWLRNTGVRNLRGLKKQAFMYLKYFTSEPLGCDFTHVDAASGETATGVRSKYLVWT